MNKKYCSIDLEFTGFDPEKEQILEIGFAFFDLGKNGLEIGETWSQVFKPTVEVHQKILGLTGITQEEIDVAPGIAEYREFLSAKLSDAILVAHNPVLDVKFLELAGVKLSGQVIDTLELVQFLLPTHHSYNLENLMHYFGIEHKNSHRALGDSISTISLLERMIGIYNTLPLETKNLLQDLIAQGSFVWGELLNLNFISTDVEANDSLRKSQLGAMSPLDVSQEIIIDPDHFQHEARVAYNVGLLDEKSIVTIHDKQEVLNLWRQGLVEGVFESEDLFNEIEFEKFLQRAVTPEELRFCMKVVVWKAINWQTKTVLDLNLSFFGGQFKQFIVGGEYKSATEKVAACEYRTLQSLASSGQESERTLVVCDMQRFEKYLTVDSKQKLSWSTFNFIIKSLYNPETGTGDASQAERVIAALVAVDLFFGLVQIILRRYSKNEDYIELSQLERLQSVYYGRLRQAAGNLSSKLAELSDLSGHPGIGRLSTGLDKFFQIETEMIKWIELSEENVYLHSQPIRIERVAGALFSNFSRVKLTDSVSHPKQLFYLVGRLGFDTEIAESANSSTFSAVNISERGLVSADDTLALLEIVQTPVAVIFPTSGSIKTFYKGYYEKLRDKFHLFAQEYSGSGNKIFRNFRIFSNSLLLATTYFVNRQKYQAPCEHIVYLSWPATDIKHPYYSAIVKEYADSLPEVADLLSLNQIVFNLKQLSGRTLPQITASKEFMQKWRRFQK